MQSYIDFMNEKEFQKWECTNEGLVSLMDKIEKFLDKEIEVDPTKIHDIVTNLVKRFRNNSGIILTILTIVLTNSLMDVNTLSRLLDNVNISKERKIQIIEKAKEQANHKGKPEKKKKNQLWKFLNKLAEKESTNDPNAINRLGYIGKYQFGKMALKDVGLDSIINTEKFKKNPSIWPEKAQDRAMIKLLKKNRGYLGDYIEQFNNKNIGGVKITFSGLLAGSHLVGADSVKIFLDSDGKIVPKDGNGVPVTEYIKNYGGYELTL